ncbi:MAG TPA: peptide chain release factor N(5)-glutamine methyltransferase, partial [Dehalococcoidia bacterium]
MRPSVTIARTLAEATDRLTAAGIEDARLEAELLLAHASGGDRAHIIASLQEAP